MMGRLYTVLPLFSTDYSSAASCITDCGGLAIILCPNGCMGNYVRFDEPRWSSKPGNVLQMDIKEKDVIFGDIDLMSSLERLTGTKPYSFIGLVNTPVSSLIGYDSESVCSRIRDELGIPAVSIDTNGYGTYHDGISKTMEAVTEMIPEGNDGDGVALLGFNSLELSEHDISYIVDDVTRREGVRPMTYPGSNPDALRGLKSAKKNVLVSSAAVPFARSMERRYGIPYEFYSPVGSHSEGGKDVLIVGEQVRSNIIRASLLSEGLHSDVATMFTLDDRFASKNDAFIRNEGDLKELFHSGYECIIADPLLKQLAPEGVKFIPDPQPAISSRLFWSDVVGIEDIVKGRILNRS
jgi:hypothetical protein